MPAAPEPAHGLKPTAAIPLKGTSSASSAIRRRRGKDRTWTTLFQAGALSTGGPAAAGARIVGMGMGRMGGLRDQAERWFGPAIGAVALAFGAIMFYPTVLKPWMLQREARGWIETPCEILRSEAVDAGSADIPLTFKPEMRYAYRVDGTVYQSDRVHLVTRYGSEAAVRALVARHPPGTRISAFVNPSNPAESVLSREIGARIHFLVVCLGMIFFGGAILVAAVADRGR